MSALHEFDFQLCEYVNYNISRHFEDAEFANAVTSPLPRELAAYLQQETRTESGDSRPVLLNYDELMRLHSVIDFTSYKHGRHWTALAGIHSISTKCTGEISRRLAPAEARKWADASEHFAQALGYRPLTLADGIWTVYDWIGELRWYMEAMGEEHLIPFPSGQFPSPTNPVQADRPQVGATAESQPTDTSHEAPSTLIPAQLSGTSGPPASTPESQGKPAEVDQVELEAYVQIMRDTIKEHPKGREARPTELLKQAGAREKLARHALRELERQDEYAGFVRKRPVIPPK